MSDTLTLAAYNNTGTSLGTITIYGDYVYGTDYYDEMYNVAIVRTLDLNSRSYGSAKRLITCRVIMQTLSSSDGALFRGFLRDTLKFRTYYLGVGIHSAPFDIGLGQGVSVVFANRARLISNNGENLSEIVVPGDHNIDFTFEYKV